MAQFTHRRSVQTAETDTTAAHNGLPHPPRWRRHPAPPPYPASPDPRMVTQDGRHSGHHLGEPNHEFDLVAAATCDVTFGPDALSLRRIERGGYEYVMPIQKMARMSAVAAGAAS